MNFGNLDYIIPFYIILHWMENGMSLGDKEPHTIFYDQYHIWKNWRSQFTCDSDQAGYYEGELRGFKLTGANVLEIGFGDGNFLAWLKTKGSTVFGTEINQNSCDIALKNGVAIISRDLPSIASDYAENFDTIVAFDVFEHLQITDVSAYLSACELMLRPGGKLLLRFPNTQSPFGLAPQMSDPTHCSNLNRSVLELLTISSDFTIERYASAYRYTGTALSPRWIKRIVRFGIQRMISRLLKFVYAADIPFEPVVVIVLTRKGK